MILSVVLPDIRSVHNVGSIFRTADAVGVEKIFCCGYTPTPLDRFGRVRQDFGKVSLGAERSVAWERAEAAEDVLRGLKAGGWSIFAVEQADGAVPYHLVPKDALRDARIALVMGNEVDGLPPSVLAYADRIIEIPMRGAKESLNVAVAFGIVAYGLAYA